MAKQNSINNFTQSLEIDPGASGDSYIQFSINTTGEWRVGCDDDDSDALVISQGSALGTNNTWRMSSSGERTMPLQPAFLAYLASNDNNVTGDGTFYYVGTNVAYTEVFDQGGDFNTNGTFTAPVTGRYLITASCSFGGITASHNDLRLQLNGTGIPVTQFDRCEAAAVDVSGNYISSGSTVLDMDASDTARMYIYTAGGTKVVDVLGTTELDTSLGGYLIC